MLVELNGEKYAIRFEHDTYNKFTTAALYKVEGEYVSGDGSVADGKILREGNYILAEPEIATGISYCHYKDQFSKKTGRKIALARLLEILSIHYNTVYDEETGEVVDVVEIKPDTPIYLYREDRTRIWEQYFQYVSK